MISIQSISNERSTDDVIQWLHYLKEDISLNLYCDEYSIQDLKIEFSNEDGYIATINNNEIVNHWYRRGEFLMKNSINKYKINAIIDIETKTPLLTFLHSSIFKNAINSHSDNHKYKLITLKECLNLDINIPKTLVTNCIKDVVAFSKKINKIISKPIENATFNFDIEKFNIAFSPGIKILENENFENSPKSFSPTLFQEYIEKKFEIRSFYLNGVFKSMAIFSQQNEKTKLDFRNYDYEKPNRNVPFNLPKELEEKLHQLMLKLDINCGSFDIIYTPSGKYYFLEVNPIGQFQWLSHNCNYFIERLIAKELLKNEY